MNVTKPLLEIYNEYCTASDLIKTEYIQVMQNEIDAIYSDRIIERLFEVLFMRFESFIETSIVSYCMGMPSANGIRETCYLSFPTAEGVLYILQGQKKFPDWTQWDFLSGITKSIFLNSPYSCIAENQTILSDIKSIRNALVHMSGVAKTKYESLVRRELGSYPATGLKVAEFLKTHVPNTRSVLYFLKYADALKGIAKLICRA